jgi:hypothetical protein
MKIDLIISPEEGTIIQLDDRMINISRKRNICDLNIVRAYQGVEYELATVIAQLHSKQEAMDQSLGQVGKDNPSAALEYIKDRTNKLIAEATALGIVVKIDTVPLKPLAMRNYELVADVYPTFVRDTD